MACPPAVKSDTITNDNNTTFFLTRGEREGEREKLKMVIVTGGVKVLEN